MVRSALAIPDLKIVNWQVTARDLFVMAVASPTTRRSIHIKANLRAADGNNVLANYEALVLLSRKEKIFNISIPKPLCLLREEVNGCNTSISAEESLAGGVIGRSREKDMTSAVDVAYKGWERMSRTWATQNFDRAEVLGSRIQQWCAELKTYGMDMEFLQPNPTVVDMLLSRQWPRMHGVEHGDYSPGNLLMEANGVLGVVDWGELRVEGLPELDLIHLALYGRALELKRAIGDAWRDALDGKPPPLLLRHYRDAEMISAICCVYWLHFVCRSLSHVNETWRRVHVVGGANAISNTWGNRKCGRTRA